MKTYPVKHIYIDAAVTEDSFTERICSRLPDVPVTVVSSEREIPYGTFSVRIAKRIIYITRYKGMFCKPCPGTNESYICCNYYVINEMTGCPLDCRYCILQDYLDTPVMRIYVNYDQIFKEYEALQKQFPGRIFRIGTGELADSLALESITGLSSLLLPYFANRQNTLFELKTKTNQLPEAGTFNKTRNIVLSWSLNTDSLIKVHEKGASSLKERIEAASRAADLGFKLGFHLDPLIHYENWEAEYRSLIDRLFDSVDADKIVWISMGGLRFTPGLGDLMRQRYPESPLIRDEQITGMDRKIRYFKPLRKKIFGTIYSRIRSYSDDVFVYYCMEDRKIWEQTMGFAPVNSNHLDYLFAKSLYERFPELDFTEPDYDYYQSLHIKHNPERQQKV